MRGVSLNEYPYLLAELTDRIVSQYHYELYQKYTEVDQLTKRGNKNNGN